MKVARMPLHLRWELYPVVHEEGYKYGGSYFEELDWWTKPRQKSGIRSIIYMLKKYLFFGEYYRRNRGYWFGLYSWHIGFYLLVSFQILSFLGALAILTAGLSVSAESARQADTTLFSRFFEQLISEGIYWPPSQFETAFVSVAHSDEDIQLTIRAADKALSALKSRR